MGLDVITPGKLITLYASLLVTLVFGATLVMVLGSFHSNYITSSSEHANCAKRIASPMCTDPVQIVALDTAGLCAEARRCVGTPVIEEALLRTMATASLCGRENASCKHLLSVVQGGWPRFVLVLALVGLVVVWRWLRGITGAAVAAMPLQHVRVHETDPHRDVHECKVLKSSKRD